MAVQHDRTTPNTGKTLSERYAPHGGGRLGGTRAESQRNGNDPNEILHDDCTWGNQRREDSDQGQNSVGKILSHVRELQQSHLAYAEAQQQRIESLEMQVLELLEKEESVD